MNDSELLQKLRTIYDHFASTSVAPSLRVAAVLGYQTRHSDFILDVIFRGKAMTLTLKKRIINYKFPVSDTGGKPGAGASQANDAPPATPQIEMRRLRGRMVPVEG